MEGETVTWGGILGAVAIGVVIAVLIAVAINAWNKRR